MVSTNITAGLGGDDRVLTANGDKTVSYTHLDVYKRQILDLAKQSIDYRVTTAAGGVVEAGEWAPTTDTSILVGDIGHRSRSVEIRLVGPSLDEVGLDAIQVRVGITVGSDTDAASAFFDGTGGPSQTLSLPAAPDAPPGFRYQTTAFKADGTQHVAAWAASAQPLIVVSTRTV